MSRLFILICLTLMQPVLAHDPETHHHHAVHEPSTVTIYQRSSRSLDTLSGHVTLSLGDITRGQVRTRLYSDEGHTLNGFPRHMRPGDHVPFFDQGHHYQLSLLSMRNELIGNDSAVFRVALDPHHHQHHGLTENEKIDRLIQAVANLDGAEFLRNDDAYSADKAATHLQRKWAWKGAQVTTANDFIDVVATRSSETGERYRIRLADGRVIDSAQWFRAQLQTILKHQDGLRHTH